MKASIHLSRSDPRYPPTLTTYLGHLAPELVSALGDLEILQRRTLALFCSVKCPGNLILQTYELVHKLRHAGITVIRGRGDRPGAQPLCRRARQ
jgi:predicted Rossmann fold nucleotide-binding protein DprA/Smf involved in DNA uptake